MDDSMEVDYYGAERSLGTLEEEFHEALSQFSNDHGRSEDDQKVEANLLTSLEDICKGGARQSHTIDTIKEMLLNAESVTWLLLNMRRCELDWEVTETVPASQLVESNAYEVVEALEKDREFRRLECIVMWLEVQQRELLEDHQDEITGMSMWSGTRGWIKDGDRRWGEKDSLDPDAPYRRSLVYEGKVKKLSQVDEADDCKLLERVWRYIRAGKLEAAVDLCRRCGQAWRAASIGGGEPWVNVSESGRMRRFNSLRSLQWRLMCYKMATRLRDVESKQRHGDPKHRDSVVHWEWTVYAALASCPELLTQSDKCKTWEDQCWAYFQAKREGYYAKRLRQVREERRKCSELYPDLVSSDVENECQGITSVDGLSVEEIFGKIQSKSGPLLQERVLQAAIIKSSLDQVLKELPSEASIQGLRASSERKDGLRRLVVHLGIYVKAAMGQHFLRLPHGVQDRLHELIEAYMDQLMADGRHVQLTALYAAYLPLPAMHRKFSDCMKAVYRSQDRQECLAQCQTWLFPVLDIVLNDVLEHCRRCPFRNTSVPDRRSAEAEAELLRQDLRDASPRLGDVASRVALPELLWLKALEWCRLGPRGISAYSLVHVNAFLRELVMSYALETEADVGGGALISDSFRVIMAYAQQVLRVEPVYVAGEGVPAQLVGISREWGYWQAYSDAQDAYLGWQAAHADLSAQLETLARVGQDRSSSRDMAVTIATGAALERIQDLTSTLIRALKETSKKLRAVLNPPDGGRWMRAVDMGASRPTQDMVQEHIFNQARTEQRAEELRRLQATCIPELTAMLDRVYFETGSTVERAFVGRGAVGGLNPDFLASAREFTEDCYMLSMKVAEVVASPQFNLHELFPKGPGQTGGSLLKKPFTLDDFMKRMERSSLALLKLTQSTQWAAIADRVKENYEMHIV